MLGTLFGILFRGAHPVMFRAHYWQFSGTMLDAGHQTQLGLCKVSILPTAIAPAPAPHLENLSAILPAAGSWCPASVDWPAHCRISMQSPVTQQARGKEVRDIPHPHW